MDRLINLNLADVKAVATSHTAGFKQVISAGFDQAMVIKQIAVGMLNAGDVITPHTHPDMDECYHFLEGTGTMYLDDMAIALKGEQVINVPAGTEHRIVCTAPLRFFYLSLELKD